MSACRILVNKVSANCNDILHEYEMGEAFPTVVIRNVKQWLMWTNLTKTVLDYVQQLQEAE